MQSRPRSVIASLVSGAVVATVGVALAPPARAAGQDDATAAVTGFFTRFAADFLPQVASSTSLSQQLPTLAITPAESVGLKTAFSQALQAGGQLENAGDQTTLTALTTYIDGADGGGWDFTATKPGDNAVTVEFTRTVEQDAGLDIRDQDGTLSLSTGTGIDVTGTLSGSFTFEYDAAADQASLTKPSMTIATTADLPDGKQLNAGLGILGVKVVGTDGDDDYRLESSVTTAWANPDNDAAGSLGFDNAGTPAADDGELAADGAGSGLVTATRSGSLEGHLVAEPRASTLVAGLPSVGATIDLTTTAPGTFEAPVVTAVVPAEAQPFLTLTPRDLAAGLSQAASALLGIQDAKDGNLPLMRGSIANAIDAVGGIKAFLADQVPDADPDDQTPGQPKFASVQDMLAALDEAEYASSGWTIDVLSGTDAATYDEGSEVLTFTIRTQRDGVEDLELNILGAPTTGAGTFSATGLTATGVDFNGPQGTSGADLLGRRVTAGTSFGTIASISGDHTLTLTDAGWSDGTPADGTNFSVEAADPKTGAPEFANVLEEDTGIAAANAALSTAKVTPVVTVTLPMALDLSAPLTYDDGGVAVPDCDPSEATAPCPFQQVDASGLGRVITSLPLASDRILLRQSDRNLLVADAAINSPVQINTSSGFLALSIAGDVDVTVPAGEHLQTVAMTGEGNISIPAFVEEVRKQATRTGESDDDVFVQTLGGLVSADIDISVDDAPDAFADDQNSTSLTLEATVADLADGIDADDVTVTAADEASADLLKALNFEPNNPTSLFGGVQAAFEKAGSDLTTLVDGGLDVPIPFVGSSVGQLIGAGASGAGGVTYSQKPATADVPATTWMTDPGATFGAAFVGRQIVVGSTLATIVAQDGATLVLAPQLNDPPADDTPYLVENELLGAVHVLQATTPATLQEAVAIAQASLGNDSTIDFGLVQGDDGAQLRLDLTWERKYGVSRAVNLEFGDTQLVGVDAGGELSIEATGTVKLRLLLPLTADAMLDPIDNTLVDAGETKIDFGVKVAADDAHIGANLGPVSIDLGTEEEPGSFHAGFGVEVTGSTTDETPSIGDYFTDGFDVGLTNGAACEAATAIVCADFPVFISGAQAPGGNLEVTTTLGSGDDLTDVFVGTQTDISLPTGLQAIIDGTPFEFGTLAEGLQQYLFYAETALRTASNDGEMPVIGKDLQAGADFMGDTRKKIGDFIDEAGDPSTVGGATTILTTELGAALDIEVNGPTGIQLAFTCRSTLNPPDAPTAEASGAAETDTTAYLYKVVSLYKESATVTHDSIPSDATAEAATNATPLTATKFNTVTWPDVAMATGYKILRATQTGETVSAYRLVGTVGKVLTFKDTFATTTTYTAATKPYRLSGVDCAPETSVTEIEGVTLGLVLGQGKITPAKGCEDDADLGECLTAKLPLDLGMPGLSVQTGEGGSVSGGVGWKLDVKIGMSRSRGFFVDTTEENEFAVGAFLKLDQADPDNANVPDLKAQLSIINVDVKKRGDKSEFAGHFGIDITDPDGALTLAEMARVRVADAIVVSVKAKVDIDWHLQGAVDAALPGIGTDFKLTWAWGEDTAPDAPPVKASNTDNLVIRFDHVTLNVGEFLGKALKPYLKQIVDASKPLQPIIDTVFTPMPVISDLSKAAGGQEVTIATLAEKFNTLPGGAKIKPFLDAIKTVKTMLGAVKCDLADCGVDIGSFNLLGARTATTNATAGNAKAMIGTTTPNAQATQQINAKDTSGQLATKVQPRSTLAAGISIPVVEDPTLLFELISGGDIPLVEFDSGPLSLGFQFQKSFGPIYAPPPVMMVIGGGASVELRIAAGFDTFGIRKAIETGDGAQVLDSLYFKTVDKSGKPIPVVKFTGYLEAGASVSLGILEVGVLGGIKLTVGFYWNDPNNDGKFRLFEFAGAVANNPICLFNVGGELSLYIKVFVEIGISPFSVSFDFTLVNIKLLDFNLKPNCTPPPPRLGGTKDKVLYVFAGKFGGGGPRGDPAWDANGKDETWVVRQVPGFTDDDGDVHEPAVEVRGLGLTESFPDPASTGISTVVFDGRGYPGNLTVSFTGGSAPLKDAAPSPFTKKAVVFTGAGDDVIRTGEGNSWVDAGAGSDLVTTLDRTDLSKPADSVEAHVAGGRGADSITVGNGKDTVTGDGSLVATSTTVAQTVALAPALAGTATLADPIDVSTLADPAPAVLFAADPDGSGADQISAGLGQVRLSGNGGADTIGTANDSTLAGTKGIKAGTTGGSAAKEALYRARPSVLVGGAGSDALKSGSADDEVYTGGYDKIGESGSGAGDASTDTNTVDTGAGSDTVYGSNGRDFVTTASTPTQKAIVYGGAGTDVLTGGLGSDEIYGGPDDDYIVAAPATVGGPGSATDVLGSARDVEVLPGAGSSPKKLVGGTGSDRIYGADGTSVIFGDTTVDTCAVQSTPVSKQPGETTVEQDAADLILGGNGVDVVNAGGGGDWVYASGGADRVCGNSGTDRLYGGDDADLVFGGSGPDQGYGESGTDQVYGNDGADTLYGGADADRIQGNSGADWLDGGSDADVLLGGTSAAAKDDGSDALFGADGADVLVGDNAQSDELASAPYPTDLGSTDAAHGGNDYLVAGDGDDRSYGGLGADESHGGTGDDHAEGNPGSDRIRGDAGGDDLVGGSSELASGLFTGSEAGRPDSNDELYGGDGQDVVAGDNARVVRGGTAHPVMAGRGLVVARGVDLADESSGSPTGVGGDDLILGGEGADVVFGQRGNDDVTLDDGADYGEGGPGTDVVRGGDGDDDVLGGSFTAVTGLVPNGIGQPDGGDVLTGNAGEDVVLGDNGALLRSGTSDPLTIHRVAVQRLIAPHDLGDAPASGTSGADTITGGADNDVLLGQGGDDQVDGGAEADYAEGGQGSDLVLGGSHDDEVVGGSAATTSRNSAGAIGQPDGADNVYGGTGSDLLLGDNGLVTRVLADRDWRTNRANATQTDLVPGRAVAQFDLNGVLPAAAHVTHSAPDALSGQAGVDVILGQDGNDRISGGGDDDYVEGQGGGDAIHGDAALTVPEIVAAAPTSAWTTPTADGADTTEGQDDLTGGWSRPGYRDGNDAIHGDGDDDFVVGDNGSIARVVDAGTTDRVYTQRYGASRSGHAKVRVAGGGATSTRFCPTTGTSTTSTCEGTGAYGNDVVHGDAGQDVLHGQDGADTLWGGADDDDLYGELGADVLYGESGEDVILGDRGGVQNRYESGSRSTTSSLSQPPALTYTSRLAGSVSRETDLLHDVNGADFVGGASSSPMPLDGATFGGVDRIRGGDGHDSIHGGAGNDLVNGDSGGDAVFGGRGNDVLWGGLGKACAPTDTACLIDPGASGEWIDHLAGGKDQDVIDWRPRGAYGTGPAFTGRTCSTTTVAVTTKKDGTTDPCSWFEMTDRADDVAATTSTFANNQHHQGVDWIYGGWDRDVMQADLAANGPNPGDRLIDWSGVYNLYSHCNAAYGGFNDVRSPSPAMHRFLQEWATGNGAGRPAGSGTPADVLVPGTSAYDELALVTTADGKGHGTGKAYPSTPGHFDDANACSGF